MISHRSQREDAHLLLLSWFLGQSEALQDFAKVGAIIVLLCE